MPLTSHPLTALLPDWSRRVFAEWHGRHRFIRFDRLLLLGSLSMWSTSLPTLKRPIASQWAHSGCSLITSRLSFAHAWLFSASVRFAVGCFFK